MDPPSEKSPDQKKPILKPKAKPKSNDPILPANGSRENPVSPTSGGGKIKSLTYEPPPGFQGPWVKDKNSIETENPRGSKKSDTESINPDLQGPRSNKNSIETENPRSHKNSIETENPRGSKKSDTEYINPDLQGPRSNKNSFETENPRSNKNSIETENPRGSKKSDTEYINPEFQGQRSNKNSIEAENPRSNKNSIETENPRGSKKSDTEYINPESQGPRSNKNSFETENQRNSKKSDTEYINPEFQGPRSNKNSFETENQRNSKNSDTEYFNPQDFVPQTANNAKLSLEKQSKGAQADGFISCQCAITPDQGQSRYSGTGEENISNNRVMSRNTNEPLKTYRSSVRAYLDDNKCDMNIILGQRQKDNVKAVGEELLAMGKRVLNEMDFTDNLLDEECRSVKEACNFNPQCNFEAGCQCCQCQSRPRNKCLSIPMVENSCEQAEGNCLDMKASENWICDIERSKKEFIEAFGKICQSIDQARGSKPKISQQTPYDKGEFMKQPSNAYNEENNQKVEQLTDRLTLLEGKFIELDDQVGELINTVLKQNTGMGMKITNLEYDITYMAKLIHELQSVTKLQMHLGNAGTDQD